MKAISIGSETDTERFAELLAHSLSGGLLLGLSGDLGAGKTTFVRYLIAALGGRSSDVTSPSFTLQNEYSIPGGVSVEHWDLYRVRDLPEELLEPSPGNILRIIEWPEKCPALLPQVDLMVSFEVLDSGERRVVIGGREASRVFSTIGSKMRKSYGD